MKNTIELAAEFIRRAAFVDANALPKDECGVEYQEPSQAQYYALFRNHEDSKAINEALKHVADTLGCRTQAGSIRMGTEGLHWFYLGGGCA